MPAHRLHPIAALGIAAALAACSPQTDKNAAASAATPATNGQTVKLLNVSYDVARDFYKDFADALSNFDEVILTEIYPAREQPIPGVTSDIIYNNLKEGVEKDMIKKDDVLNYVNSRDFDVLVVLGAGNLDNYVPQIAKIIESK